MRAFRLLLIRPTTTHFRDLAPDDTTYAAIETAAAAGWAGGYPDGTFRPADLITREVLAALVVKAARWTLEHPSVGHFRDVPTANQFYALIETGYAHGIFGDKPDETFRPDAQATRGELAQIIYRASVPAEPGEPAQPPKSGDHQQP